jgi:autophagy-related protein 18
MCAQAVMAWNHEGSLLASASQKGTVLRVHRLPQAAKAFTFRRAPFA